MVQPDRPVATPPDEGWPATAVDLQRQQRRAKRIVQRTALFVIVGPVGLALLAFLILELGSGSGWSMVIAIPLIAIAVLVALALPLLVPALFVLGAWALFRSYYKKPAAAARMVPDSDAASPHAA